MHSRTWSFFVLCCALVPLSMQGAVNYVPETSLVSFRVSASGLPAGVSVTSGGKASGGSGTEITGIFLNIIRTDVYSDTDGWLTVQTDPHVYDLLRLVNNMSAALGSAPFKPGSYSQVRLILGEGNYVTTTENGVLKTYPLKVPSGEQTGLHLTEGFQVVKGKLVQIKVALDLSSLHYVNGLGGYNLRPTMKITGIDEFDGIKEIGPEGGQVASLDGMMQIDVPEGAVSLPALFTILRLEDAATPSVDDPTNPYPNLMTRIESAYELLSGAKTFSVPVKITARYTDDHVQQLVGTDHELSLAIHRYNEQRYVWERMPSEIDYNENTLVYNAEHFSTYAVVSNTNGLVLGADDRELVTNDIQMNQGFLETRHVAKLTSGCTGFMISRHLLMTNHHCLQNNGCPLGASFNKIQDPQNSPLNGETSFFSCNRVELDLPQPFDVAILRLNPDFFGQAPGDIWGWYQLANYRAEVGAYNAGFPSDRASNSNPYDPTSPFKGSGMDLDRSSGCRLYWLNPIESFFWDGYIITKHGCDMNAGSSGSPLVGIDNRNVVYAINHSFLVTAARINGIWIPLFYNFGTWMKAVIDRNDANANGVMDLIESDLPGGVALGFSTCVEPDHVCGNRWFLWTTIQFQAVGGQPPYTWRAESIPNEGGWGQFYDPPAPLSSDGVMVVPPNDGGCIFCSFHFKVCVKDSNNAEICNRTQFGYGL